MTPPPPSASWATDAVENGAEEVDMVINLGWVKDQKWDDLLAEIKAVKAACKGRLLKVIIECCFLTDEEKIKMCEIVTASGAEYIKTSTGFGTGGATREDVALFAKHVGPDVKIKAAGGIARPEGRGGLHQPGCLPPGHQPHRQGREGHGREIRRK